MSKKETRGGAGRNQGLRPGTYKNAKKPLAQHHSVKRQVSYTHAQAERVDAAMAKLGVTKHTEFARDAVLRYVNNILRGRE